MVVDVKQGHEDETTETTEKEKNTLGISKILDTSRDTGHAS